MIKKEVHSQMRDMNSRWFRSREAEFRLFTSNQILFSAITQMILTTNLALQVFSPLYVERGIGASIGAHMTWNFNVFFLGPNLIIRFLDSKTRSVRKRIWSYGGYTGGDTGVVYVAD